MITSSLENKEPSFMVKSLQELFPPQLLVTSDKNNYHIKFIIKNLIQLEIVDHASEADFTFSTDLIKDEYLEQITTVLEYCENQDLLASTTLELYDLHKRNNCFHCKNAHIAIMNNLNELAIEIYEHYEDYLDEYLANNVSSLQFYETEKIAVKFKKEQYTIHLYPQPIFYGILEHHPEIVAARDEYEDRLIEKLPNSLSLRLEEMTDTYVSYSSPILQFLLNHTAIAQHMLEFYILDHFKQEIFYKDMHHYVNRDDKKMLTKGTISLHLKKCKMIIRDLNRLL